MTKEQEVQRALGIVPNGAKVIASTFMANAVHFVYNRGVWHRCLKGSWKPKDVYQSADPQDQDLLSEVWLKAGIPDKDLIVDGRDY